MLEKNESKLGNTKMNASNRKLIMSGKSWQNME